MDELERAKRAHLKLIRKLSGRPKRHKPKGVEGSRWATHAPLEQRNTDKRRRARQAKLSRRTNR